MMVIQIYHKRLLQKPGCAIRRHLVQPARPIAAGRHPK